MIVEDLGGRIDVESRPGGPTTFVVWLPGEAETRPKGDRMSTEPARPRTLEAHVSGSVQGVGFRFFVMQEARRLGLAGRVRNLPDGRVEVRARGEQGALEQLVLALRQGPRLARVSGVNVEWGAPCPETDGFDVAH